MASKEEMKAEALKGADKLFSVNDKEPKRTSGRVSSGKKGNTKTSTKKPPEAKIEGQKVLKKDTQKVFSFRAEIEDVDAWRIYADAKGMKVDDLGQSAMKEYINRHKLGSDEQKIYDLKMKNKK